MFSPGKTGILFAFFWIKKNSDLLHFHDRLVTWIINKWLCLRGKQNTEEELLVYCGA